MRPARWTALLALATLAALPAAATAAVPPADLCIAEAGACAHLRMCGLFVLGPCFRVDAPGASVYGYCGVLPRSALGLPGAACSETVLVPGAPGGMAGESLGAGVSAGRACASAAVLAAGTFLAAPTCLPS